MVALLALAAPVLRVAGAVFTLAGEGTIQTELARRTLLFAVPAPQAGDTFTAARLRVTLRRNTHGTVTLLQAHGSWNEEKLIRGWRLTVFQFGACPFAGVPGEAGLTSAESGVRGTELGVRHDTATLLGAVAAVHVRGAF